MSEFINTNMLIIAREVRGMSQSELAEKVGVSQGSMGKMERNDYGVSIDILKRISAVTRFPLSFFYQHGDIVPENLNYRKREKVAQRLLTPINAKVNLFRKHVQIVTHGLNLSSPSVPAMEVNETNTPAAIAVKLRRQWKIERPVIANLSALVEQHGIVILGFDFGTDRVDSRSVLTEDNYPVLILNSSLLGDRQRFSLAYQLGHLVMHAISPLDWNRDVSHEANLFAAELLMPEKEIRNDFKDGISVTLLGELKRKWRVSMIALLYRADDLGYLTANQKRYLLQQFNELKIRRREPLELDVPIEKPTLMRKWLNELKTKHQLDVKGMASLLHLHTDEFIELYN